MSENGLPSLVAVGRVLRPHGLKGHVKVQPFVSTPERFGNLDILWVTNEAKEIVLKTKIDEYFWQNRFVVLKLDTVNNCEAAEQLKNCWLEIPADQVPPPPLGRYYCSQLEGLAVFDSENRNLGQLINTEEGPANDIYKIKLKNGQTILIPAIAEIVTLIDLNAGRMIINARAIEDLL
jgi:16S rRNA processing protein RimM